MPTADEAARFVKELIDLEYIVEVSRNTETDDAFTSKLTKLNQMFFDRARVVSGIGRPAGMSREELSHGNGVNFGSLGLPVGSKEP